MKEEKVSIIIPAYNEEKQIKRTIANYRRQSYKNKEIIIVVNNSTDNTYKIAKEYADKTLNFPKLSGVCAAKNQGVKASTGNIIVFSDADSRLSSGAIKKIVNIMSPNIVGSCLGRGDNNSIRGKIFFFLKNWTHRLRIYRGVVDGVMFCHKDIFKKAKGFNERLKVAEYQDFFKRAYKKGGKYILLTNCHAIVSLRRYEEKGYLKVHWFWIKYNIAKLFGRRKEVSKKYFKSDV
tara:strand:- start:4255 stop:4959 length:705 start_codon:yes stop_codon:yes gene_type:complete